MNIIGGCFKERYKFVVFFIDLVRVRNLDVIVFWREI